MPTFVDSNVFLRFFAGDDSQQSAASESLLKMARRGEIDLITGPPVFFEVAWVLSYRYKVRRDVVLDMLEAMSAFPGLKVIDENIVIDAIARARMTETEFADAYIAISTERYGAADVATFNKRHFTKLGVELCPYL